MDKNIKFLLRLYKLACENTTVDVLTAKATELLLKALPNASHRLQVAIQDYASDLRTLYYSETHFFETYRQEQ